VSPHRAKLSADYKEAFYDHLKANPDLRRSKPKNSFAASVISDDPTAPVDYALIKVTVMPGADWETYHWAH